MTRPARDRWVEAARRQKHFERRRRAAIDGIHLPDSEELLLGMPFMALDIERDIHAVAERLLPRFRKPVKEVPLARLVHCLEQATVSPEADQVRDLMFAFAEAGELLKDDGRPFLLRCRIYLAHFGDPRAAVALACDCVGAALSTDPDPPQGLALIESALAWLAAAAGDREFHRHLGRGNGLWGTRVVTSNPPPYGAELIEMVQDAVVLERAATDTDTTAQRREATASPASGSAVFGGGVRTDPSASDAPGGPTAVVIGAVGNTGTSEGRAVDRAFRELIAKPLPLVPLPDLAEVRSQLAAAFPYAVEIIDRLLTDLVAMPRVLLRPTILVGSPGSGKTRFARSLMSALGIPHEVFPCGGVTDSAIGGTPRRWSTGEPSLPLSLVVRFRTASPGIVLDEIEKTGTGRHNGNPLDVLLAFFEAETARRYHDPYVQAACDLSHVSWLTTANTVTDLPRPLRDRCRVLQFPDPGPEHVALLADRILRDLHAELGLDARWHLPLQPDEMTAIANAWPGGSLRKLRRMVEGVLAARRALPV